MGTTLGNLHIYNTDPEFIKTLINGDYPIMRMSDEWTSVLDVGLETVDTEAKKLSKSIDAAVFSFMYFDDDLISLKLFREGKKVAHYETYYERAPYVKSCREFLAAAWLEASLEGRLMKIFKCEDLGRKVEMLEELFGVAFYINSEFTKEDREKYRRTRGDAHFLKYEEEQKKINKIKNKTKTVLTQEMDALLWPCFNEEATNSNYFLLLNAVEEYPNDGCLAELVEDTLQRILQGVNISSDNFVMLYYNSEEFLIVHNLITHRTCIRISNDSKVLGEVTLSEKVFIATVLDNGDILCIREMEPMHLDKVMGVICYDKDWVLKWKVDTGFLYPYINPVQQGANIFFGTYMGKDMKSELYKLSMDGNVIIKKEFSKISIENKMATLGGYIFCKARDFSEGSYSCTYMKLDESFELIDRIVFPKDISICGDGAYDNKTFRAYFHTLNNSIVSIDLKNMEYTTKKIGFEFYPHIVDDEGNIYGYIGDSMLGIFDIDLNPISRHRLKGWLVRICQTETGIHAITKTVECPYIVRVYRIDPA